MAALEQSSIVIDTSAVPRFPSPVLVRVFVRVRVRVRDLIPEPRVDC